MVYIPLEQVSGMTHVAGSSPVYLDKCPHIQYTHTGMLINTHTHKQLSKHLYMIKSIIQVVIMQVKATSATHFQSKNIVIEWQEMKASCTPLHV